MPSASIEGAAKKAQFPFLSWDKQAHISSAVSWGAEAGGGNPEVTFLRFVFCLLCRLPLICINHQNVEVKIPSGPSTSFLSTVRPGAVLSGKGSQLREPHMPFGAHP